MFEHFTERARRVIFFARYEASQYGNPVIDTEHILLGLLREDFALVNRYAVQIRSTEEIRTEIEKHINRGARISPTAELPISGDLRKILTFATEESERLGPRYVGTEHILLGILRLSDSPAAKILLARGAKPNAIREQLAKGLAPTAATIRPADAVRTTIDEFLDVLRRGASDELAGFFDETGRFIDSAGKCCVGCAEIEKESERLLAPFAKRNASFQIEDSTANTSQTFLASVLWEFATASADRSKSLLRMSIVLAWEDDRWAIVLVQVTPVTI